MEMLKRLSVEMEGSRVHAGVSGREYLLNGAFPTSIQVEGEEILAAPISLKAEFNGEEKAWDEAYIIPVSQDADQCAYSIQQGAGNAFINARVRIERDGLIWIDMQANSYGTWITYAESLKLVKPTLTSLKLEIPLKREVAELYHYWPNSDNSITTGATVCNSGAVPEEGFAVPIKPCLWLGREERGLTFYMESSQYTQPRDAQKFYQLKVEGDTVLLTVDLLDSMPKSWQGKEDSWDEPIQPVYFSFGFQATPVKPYVRQKDFERVFHCEWKYVSGMNEQEFEAHCAHLASKGVKWHGFHEDWTAIQNYGLAWNESHFKRVVDALHRHGIRVMVYFGYECASVLPDWYEKWDNYVIKSASGNLRGGWQRLPHQRDYIVCYKSDYSQVLLDRVAYVMDHYGVDGIYTDSMFIPRECANQTHGCGWRDEEGKLHETFPLLAVRDLVKKLYDVVHSRGGIVEAHQSSCCVPMLLSYADSYFDGEHLGEIFAKDTSGLLNNAIIRSEFNGVNFGVPFQFLSGAGYVKGSAIMLLHGSVTKVYNASLMKSLDEASKIWKIMDDFGADDAKFVGYWQADCPAHTDHEHVLSSVWVRQDGSALVLTVNLEKEMKETRVSCNGEMRKLVVPSLTPVFEVFNR